MTKTEPQMGTITWFDIPVGNLGRSKEFYRELFGWDYESFSSAGEDYVMAKLDGRTIGGLYECKEVSPPHLMPAVMYFGVKSIDEAIKKLDAVGGKVATDKIEIPGDGGFYAHIQDLDGNLIGIWSKE